MADTGSEQTPPAISEQNLKRRVLLLLLTEWLWGMGTYFVLPSTTIPSVLKSLGASAQVVGMMATLMVAIPLLFQLPARRILRRCGGGKRGLIGLHAGYLLAYPCLALLYWSTHCTHPEATLVGVIALLAVSQSFLGIVTPLWIDMIGMVIPSRLRGRYFGVSSACFAIGGVLGALTLSLLSKEMGRLVFPAAFGMAGVLFALSMTAFACVPIPHAAFHPDQTIARLGAQVRQAARLCHPRLPMGRLLLSACFQMSSAAMVPFLVVYATSKDGLHMPAAIFGRITVYEAVGGALLSLLAGWLMDRVGPRIPWVFVTLVMPVVVLLYPYAHTAHLLFLCSFLVGMLIGHWAVFMPALLLLTPPGDRSITIALVNLVLFIPASLSPLVLGWIIDHHGYPLAFRMCQVAGLLAVLSGLGVTMHAKRVEEHAVHG